MKTLLPQRLFLTAPPHPRRNRPRHAFSLVEVTLALGIVTFGLVGVVGVLPTALASGRQSFDQNRAAAIANTLFTSFRSQSFNKVCYVDEQLEADGVKQSGNGPKAVDFADFKKTDSPAVYDATSGAYAVGFYAKFLSLATDPGDPEDAFGAQRRLSFSASQPSGGADYHVALNFYDPKPQSDGTTIPASNQPEGMIAPGQACRVEVVIYAISRPANQYHFVSTVANRSN